MNFNCERYLLHHRFVYALTPLRLHHDVMFVHTWSVSALPLPRLFEESAVAVHFTCVFEPRYATHCTYESIAYYQPWFCIRISRSWICVRMNAILFINFMRQMYTSWESRGFPKSVCHSSNVIAFSASLWTRTQWHTQQTHAVKMINLPHCRVSSMCRMHAIASGLDSLTIFNGANWIYIYWMCCLYQPKDYYYYYYYVWRPRLSIYLRIVDDAPQYRS